MFVLRVTNDVEAARLVHTGWPTHVVCATTAALPSYGAAALVHVVMDDVIRPSPGVIVPAPEHVSQVLDFTQHLSAAHRLLVYCHLGLNRSPALAIAILLQHGMTMVEAYRAVADLRPALVPNRLLISYIDRQFALDGGLTRLTSRLSAPRGQRAFARS